MNLRAPGSVTGAPRADRVDGVWSCDWTDHRSALLESASSGDCQPDMQGHWISDAVGAAHTVEDGRDPADDGGSEQDRRTKSGRDSRSARSTHSLSAGRRSQENAAPATHLNADASGACCSMCSMDASIINCYMDTSIVTSSIIDL